MMVLVLQLVMIHPADLEIRHKKEPVLMGPQISVMIRTLNKSFLAVKLELLYQTVVKKKNFIQKSFLVRDIPGLFSMPMRKI